MCWKAWLPLQQLVKIQFPSDKDRITAHTFMIEITLPPGDQIAQQSVKLNLLNIQKHFILTVSWGKRVAGVWVIQAFPIHVCGFHFTHVLEEL